MSPVLVDAVKTAHCRRCGKSTGWVLPKGGSWRCGVCGGGS